MAHTPVHTKPFQTMPGSDTVSRVDQISAEESKVYRLLTGARRTRWFSNMEIATELKMARRTVSIHTRKFFESRFVEKVEDTFGGARFRWAP